MPAELFLKDNSEAASLFISLVESPRKLTLPSEVQAEEVDPHTKEFLQNFLLPANEWRVHFDHFCMPSLKSFPFRKIFQYCGLWECKKAENKCNL